MNVLRIWCVAVVVCGVAAAAPAVTVTMVAHGISPDETVDAVLRAVRLDAGGTITVQNVTVPGVKEVNVGSGVWEVRLVADGYWSDPLITSNDKAERIHLVRLGVVNARAGVTAAVRAHFSPLAEGLPTGEVDCVSVKRTVECRVPVGKYDLRFSSPGSAPAFRWAVDVARTHPVDVGTLELSPGAALVGRLVVRDGQSARDIEVSLAPAVDESRRPPASVRRARSSVRGTFVFGGLSPGEYIVEARHDGLISPAVPVRILEGKTAELVKPLVLDRPRRLTLQLAPPLDPAEKPWRVQLLGADAPGGPLNIITESGASSTGEWTHGRLRSGQYHAQVRGADGGTWKRVDVTVGEEDVGLLVDVPAYNATGRVTLGGKPLVATLSFGGEFGQRLETDADGNFAGSIAPADDDRWTVLVEAETPDVRRTIEVRGTRSEEGLLRFDIALPSGTLLGRVVNENREPQPHAILTISRPGHVSEQAFAREDGRFQITGLDEGAYAVTAQAFQRTSPPVDVTVTPDTPAELEIVLTPYVHVLGTMMINGRPVVGGSIAALPRDAWGPFVPRATTDERGRFRLELPPGTGVYDVLAIHPAFDTVIGRALVRKDKALHVEVTQHGGTLIVDADAVEDLLVVHEGAELQVPSLVRESGGALDKTTARIERLEPGAYSVCTPSKKCASGFLAPRGTLKLAIE